MYAAGPGDIIGTWRHWKENRDDPGQVAMTYSGQFYDVCKQLGAQGYAIASHPRHETVGDDQFRVEHRPIPFAKSSSALKYHLGQLISAFQMSWRAFRYRADALVICDGTCHWFPLRLLPMLGIQVIPTIHCMLWLKSHPPTGRLKRFIARLDRAFWRRSAKAILSASTDITEQIDQTTGNNHRPVIPFLPTYRPDTFEAAPPPESRTPFRVLFAGRIERYKGVFDLLEIARQFSSAGRTSIEFDLCGTGSDIDALRQQIADAGLTQTFRAHGHCDRTKMRQLFRDCHVLIVPTTTDFAEGFNQVVVEGVLAGRPVITSSICPALDYVQDAVVEVPPDNVPAYHDAILRLHDDQTLYEQKRAASVALQSQFYDPSRGWAQALLKSLDKESISTTMPLSSL
jgi:glycosyltransferase involved in cell wall biosynthesis